jgi:hypothetical protein
MAASRITDLIATLRRWPEFMADSISYSSHVAISPPGLVLIYYAAGSLLAHVPVLAEALAQPLRLMQCQNIPLMAETNAQLASAWLGILTPLWGSLTVVPLYRLGRSVFGQATARWSTVWWPLIPSLLIFAPLPSTFYPLPALVMVGLLLLGLRRNQSAWVFAAGVLCSGLTFLTFTFAPLLLLAGFLTLGWYWLKRASAAEQLPWHWPLRIGLWFGLGLSAVWLAYSAATGRPAWDVLLAAVHAHLALDRPYWPWLILHLNDFFMFTGWPLSLMAAVGVWLAAHKIIRKQSLSEGDVVTLAAALSLLVLDLSGTLRGESGRILLFLSAWILFAAASTLGDNPWLGRALTAAQAVVVVVMIVCLHVLDSGLPPAPASPPQAPLAEGGPAWPSGAVFGGAARLTTFAGAIEDGPERQTLAVWLNWQPSRPMDSAYYLSLLPVAPDGQVAPSATLLQPLAQQYPTTCWKPGDGELHDRVEVPLFKAMPGDWWVSLSLVDGQTGQALDVVRPDGSHDHQVGLGPFH